MLIWGAGVAQGAEPSEPLWRAGCTVWALGSTGPARPSAPCCARRGGGVGAPRSPGSCAHSELTAPSRPARCPWGTAQSGLCPLAVLPTHHSSLPAFRSALLSRSPPDVPFLSRFWGKRDTELLLGVIFRVTKRRGRKEEVTKRPPCRWDSPWGGLWARAAGRRDLLGGSPGAAGTTPPASSPCGDSD